jgi:hypothetical protein
VAEPVVVVGCNGVVVVVVADNDARSNRPGRLLLWTSGSAVVVVVVDDDVVLETMGVLCKNVSGSTAAAAVLGILVECRSWCDRAARAVPWRSGWRGLQPLLVVLLLAAVALLLQWLSPPLLVYPPPFKVGW